MLPAAEPTVTANDAATALARLNPPNTRSVHRVLIQFGKRQFACDGFLVINADGQRQLALISSLGLVTAVQCDPNRHGTVRQVTPLFREDWARDFVLRDLQLLFTPPPALSWLGRSSNGDWVWSAAGPEPDLSTRYLFNPDPVEWRALEVLRGDRLLYRATFDDYRVLDGRRVPGQIRVDAGPYQLHLRVADVRRASPAAP